MSTKDLFDKGYSLNFLKNKSLTDYREDVESPRYIDAYIKKRERFFPDVNYATASNFAAYGLAEEYYKQSIERIYKTYPYDGSLAEKLEWENESTYLDLFIFENEYPRSNGYVNISNQYTTTEQSDAYSSSFPQYVFFTGNPHADISGNFKEPPTAGPSGIGVSKANVYETGSQRTNNLEMDPTKGVTVEFWLKKDGWAATDSKKLEYIFNLVASGSTGDNFANFRIYALGENPGNIYLNVDSGSSSDSLVFNTALTGGVAGGLADGKWHHYAITFEKNDSVNVGKLYVDGVHKQTKNGDDHVDAFDGKLVATIGALAGPRGSNLTIADRGWGGLVSSSIDEFRYWKSERSSQQIGRHFRDQIGGGTNTDNVKYDKTHNPVDLGVYFKFNEGITGDNSIDSTVLDYSGRISNGTFVNYQSGSSRNTGSAMVSASVAEREFKDPIIYSSHPSVISLIQEKTRDGAVHDHENATSIFKSLPGWIAEEDEEKSGNLKYLIQIMSSVFDEIQLQVGSIPKLKDINYPYDAKFEKPLPFADRLLSSRGLDAPELFSDASLLAKFLQRGEKKLFEKKLYEIKNTIYQNIYNNLTYIHKSKGTMKSMRNLLRCFGVDEELVKINIYSKNGTYEFKDNVSHMALRKKYADFDDLETRFGTTGIYSGTFASTVYQYYDSTNANSLSYIPALADVSHGLAATIEAEVIFPKRTPQRDDNFGLFPGREVSLFGLHAVEASNTNLNYLNDNINFNVIAVKSNNDPRSVKFAVTSNSNSNIPHMETTGTFMGVYDNEKWNLAFRIRPVKHPLADKVNDSLVPAASSYQVELYGVNYLSDQLQNEFTLTQVLSEANARAFFSKAKRLFVGANRTNFDGDLVRASDVKISSVNMWYDYLEDDEIKAHARDANNDGRAHPYRNAIFNEGTQNDLIAGGDSDLLWTFRVPEIDTLVLSWNFENVTGSNSDGQFLVNDISSGSAEDRTNLRYGALSEVNTYHFSGRGDKFVANSDQAVDIEFVPTGRTRLPEVIASDDMVKILNQQDDVMFTRDTTFIQHIISVEKSMYQSISEEMLRMFATVTDFNNIVGSPVNRYRMNYKELSKLRNIFFEIVQNEPDIEKYIEYFKWIDDAISLFIFQLLPASSNKVEFLRTMVESHILERSKHFNKFPTIEMFNPEPNEAFKGINQLLYNWKIGHAPLQSNGSGPDQAQNQHMHSLWWKERAERTGSVVQGVNHAAVLTSGDDNIDASKHEILKVAITETSGNDSLSLSFGPSGLDKADGKYGAQGGTKTKYSASYYSDRSTSTPVRVTQSFVKTYKSGPNPDSNKIYDFYKGVVKFASDNDYIFLDKDHVVKPLDSTDVLQAEKSSSSEGFYLPNKKEYVIKALTMTGDEISSSNAAGTGDSDYKYTDALNKLTTPFSMFANKGVANGDYTVFYENYFENGHHNSQNDTTRIEINNLHHDIYRPTFEVPMQGPFNRQHVGGNQHRHISLNYRDYDSTGSLGALDTRMSRPEAWELVHDKGMSNYIILDMPFARYNMPPEMSGSDPTTGHVDVFRAFGDPEPRDRWRNVTKNDKLAGSIKGWQRATFISDPDCGPENDSGDGTTFFAYARLENEENITNKYFGYRTPLIDAHDAHRGLTIKFYYHVTSAPNLETGRFFVDYSYDEDFSDGGTNLTTTWDIGAAGQESAVILPKTLEQTSKKDSWKLASIDLSAFMGQRVYLRFNYVAAPHSFNICAIDQVEVVAVSGISSLRLLHPTHDDHHRPYAPYMREEYAKRPVNIKNIQIGKLESKGNLNSLHAGDFGALQRTIAGNYRNTYEYVNTVSREANDPTFKKLIETLPESSNPQEGMQEIASMYLGYSDSFPVLFSSQKTQHGTENRLARYLTVHQIENGVTSSSEITSNAISVNPVPGRDRREPHKGIEAAYKQKTRMVNLFSAPGDILDSCTGFLDEAHRTYSAYNCLPWRNYRIRQRMQSMLTAHCGKFGIGSHTQNATAAAGSIKIVDNNAINTYQTAVGKVFVFMITDGNGKTINILLKTSAQQPDPSFSWTDEYENLTINFVIGDNEQDTASKLLIAFNSAKALFSNTEGASSFNVSAEPDESDNSKINFTHDISGFVSNTRIYVRQVDETDQTKMVDVPASMVEVLTFIGGKNATARVYRSQAVQPPQPGVIEKADYTVVSASFHKYHRNRADKFFLGDATQDNSFYNNMQQTASTLQYADTPTDILARGSVYDNAYIGHAIPRSDDQVHWVRSVNGLVQEQLNLEYEENDPTLKLVINDLSLIEALADVIKP